MKMGDSGCWNETNELKRVAVIGTSCSGKTTFAQRLAGKLGVPHIELDALHWQPQWRPRPLETFRALTQEAVAAEAWVLDGNYSRVRDIVWSRATTLIWLNYPFHIVFWRALRRTLRRAILQETLFAGNRETIRRSFLSSNSILLWVISTYHRRRREYPQLVQQAEYAHLNVIEFRAPGEAEAFMTAFVLTTKSLRYRVDRQ